jgi:hypothetical protein
MPAPPPPAEVLVSPPGAGAVRPSAALTEVARPSPPATGVARPPATGVAPAAGAGEPHPPTEIAQPRPAGGAAAPLPVTGIVRYGPGVPVILPESRGGRTAEHVWQGQPAPGRRPHRLRRLAGPALTVILLAAAGIVFYLRFHHTPLHVTGAVIAERSPTRCGVKVTGRITTNGGAGTVSYEWLFRPGGQQPTPLSQAVAAGQDAVTVAAAIEGSGHGSAAQTVTLQVLSPGRKTASADVIVRC